MTPAEIDGRVDALLPPLPGWCTPEKGKRIAHLVHQARARHCVELGVFGGRSLIAMGLGCAANGYGRVDGIDPWTVDAALEGKNDAANDRWWSGSVNLEDVMRTAVAGVEQSGLAPFVHVLRARSLDEGVLGRYDDGSIDVLHQDSNHSEEVSCREVQLWTPKMRLGSFWVFDDVDWSTTHRAQKMLLERGYARVEPHQQWRIFQRVGAS